MKPQTKGILLLNLMIELWNVSDECFGLNCIYAIWNNRWMYSIWQLTTHNVTSYCSYNCCQHYQYGAWLKYIQFNSVSNNPSLASWWISLAQQWQMTSGLNWLVAALAMLGIVSLQQNPIPGTLCHKKILMNNLMGHCWNYLQQTKQCYGLFHQHSLCLPERTRGRPWGRLRVRIRSIEKTWSWKFYPAAQNFTNRMLFRNTYIFKTI